MRDPARIASVLSELASAWMQHPDARFFQMFDNFAHWVKNAKKVDDPYYLEDDVVVLYLREYRDYLLERAVQK